MTRGLRRTAAAAALWLLASACAPVAPSAPSAARCLAREAPAVQRLLEPRPMPGLDWLGGDVASSTLLGHGELVWIFGDTLLGEVRRDCPGDGYCGRRLAADPARALIANSVGLMRRRDGGFAPLAPQWRTAGGAPAPVLQAAEPGELLWPLALARVGRPLLVAASVHTRAAGLFSLGSVLLRVADPEAAPARWRYDRHPLPHTAMAGPGRPQLAWSSALVPLGAHVYVVGERGVGPDAATVLARFPAAGVGRPAWRPEPEYLLYRHGRLVWDAQFEEAALYRVPGLPGTSETTVHRASDGTWQTYRIPAGTFEIRLYTARALYGPWRDRGVVYRIPAPWSTARLPDGTPRYAAYGAKAHPALGSADAPVLTYNVNVASAAVAGAAEMERVPALYVPRALVMAGSASGRGPCYAGAR